MLFNHIFVTDTTEFYYDFMVMSNWSSLLSDMEQDQFRKCGYYRHDLSLEKTRGEYNLIFLVLNTNIYAKSNYSGSEDPCEQLEWLDGQLNEVTNSASNRIFILAHIPPGYFERDTSPGPFFQNVYKNDTRFNDRYLEIITKHSEKPGAIVAHFYGHTHTDSFRLFKQTTTSSSPMLTNDTPIGLGLISPSVAPKVNSVYGTNPGIRLYKYNPSNAYLSNYHQYNFNLEEANHAKHGKQTGYWRELYNFTGAYKIEDMSLDSMGSLTLALTQNEDLLRKYIYYNTLGSVEQGPSCKYK